MGLFDFDLTGGAGQEANFGFGDVGGFDFGDLSLNFAPSDFDFSFTPSPIEANDPGFGLGPSMPFQESYGFAQAPSYRFDQGLAAGVPFNAADFGYAGYDRPGPAFAGGEQAMFDTTSGELVQPSGQRISMSDILRGGEFAPGREFAGGEIAAAGQPGGGFLERLTAAVRPYDALLGTGVGRALGAGAIGLLGLGASRLAAGREPRLNLLPYTPSPATAAGQQAVLDAFGRGIGPQLTETLQLGVGGQRAIAEQLAARGGRELLAEAEAAPLERLTRLQALGLAPGLVAPELADPVREALRAELLGVLGNAGGGVSPATAIRQQREEQAERIRLERMQGRDYELTTPGIQALNELRQRHNAERFLERQATIARISPLEESRFAASEGRRRGALADVAGLSQFGLRGVPENVGALNQLAPLQQLYGGDPERQLALNFNVASRQAETAFGQASQNRRELAAGVGGIFGNVASAIGNRPSRLETLLEESLARSGRSGSSGYGY